MVLSSLKCQGDTDHLVLWRRSRDTKLQNLSRNLGRNARLWVCKSRREPGVQCLPEWLLPPERPRRTAAQVHGPRSMAGLGPVAAACLPADQRHGLLSQPESL